MRNAPPALVRGCHWNPIATTTTASVAASAVASQRQQRGERGRREQHRERQVARQLEPPRAGAADLLRDGDRQDRRNQDDDAAAKGAANEALHRGESLGGD